MLSLTLWPEKNVAANPSKLELWKVCLRHGPHSDHTLRSPSPALQRTRAISAHLLGGKHDETGHNEEQERLLGWQDDIAERAQNILSELVVRL